MLSAPLTAVRSAEHTSALQSPMYSVRRRPLEVTSTWLTETLPSTALILWPPLASTAVSLTVSVLVTPSAAAYPLSLHDALPIYGLEPAWSAALSSAYLWLP